MKSAPSSSRRRTLCAFHRRAPRALTFATLLGLAGTPAALQAADYTYNNATGNFSTGFTPSSPANATTADDLIFGGAAYTATDDVSGINVNGVRFNNTGIVTIARGTASDNNINLGGTNPYLDFNNTGLVTSANDRTFTTSGFIVKSTAGAAASNPIISGALTLSGATTNVQVLLADTPGDGTAELSLTGVISGAGSLTLQNNANLPAALTGNAGIAAPANQQDYGTLLLTGANTYTGGTNINAGRLVITNGTAFGTGAVTIGGAATNATNNIASAGGTLAFGNGNYTGTASGVIATGITVANAVNFSGATNGVYGHGIENNLGNNTLSGLVTLTGATPTVSVVGNTSLSMTGGVTQAAGLSAGLIVQGSGRLNLTNATYTGATVIQGGSVQFNPAAGASTTANTGPTGGLNIGNSVANANASLNVGPGTAFPNVTNLLSAGIVANTSTGSINLTGSYGAATSNLDFSANSTLFLGSAVTTGTGATYGGTFTQTSANINLGGYNTITSLTTTAPGILTLPNDNQLDATFNLTVNPVGGNQIVAISGQNPNYAGTTTIQGGTLQVGTPGNLGSSSLLAFGVLNGTTSTGGGTLQYAPGITAAGGTPEDFTTFPGGAGTLSGFARFTRNGNTIIDTNGNNVTYANSMAGNSGFFTKAGLGTLTLQAGENGGSTTANTVTAGVDLFVRAGTLALSGANAFFRTTGFSSVGQLQGDNGTLILSGGATSITPSDFNVSDVNGTTGSVIISGNSTLSVNTLYVGKGGNNAAGVALATNGAVNQSGGVVNNNAAGGDWRIGGGGSTTDGSQNAVGTYDLSGGTFATTSNFQPGSYGTGQMTITGGTASTTAFPSVGRFATGYGVLNVLGGAFNQTATGTFLIIGEAGNGTLNVGQVAGAATGGTVTAAGAQLRIGNGAGATGVVNLGTGGTINANAINTLGGTSTFDFHGGTLSATAASTAYMAGLTNAYVYGEGGTINTNANNITIAQRLLAPTGTGVTTIPITNGGSGYVASPIIRVTGTGTGATAIPVLTNGVLTAVTITNPGINYTGTPTVSIVGGNAFSASGVATPATLGIPTLGANTTTGSPLVKIGTGTLTLSGTNTYNNGTLISAGVLAAAANSALGTGNVTIGAAGGAAATLSISTGVTNAIADSATLAINGAGTLALNGTNGTSQETVNILQFNGTTLAAGTYGAAGSGATNTEPFITGTGYLTVTSVPEPGTWAMLGLGVVVLGATGYARRRREQQPA